MFDSSAEIPGEDSNLDEQDQNLLCYHYTTGEFAGQIPHLEGQYLDHVSIVQPDTKMMTHEQQRSFASRILPSKKVATTQRMTFHREWHTQVTRLYRVEKQPVAVWYPDGPVSEGTDKLEIRNE